MPASQTLLLPSILADAVYPPSLGIRQTLTAPKIANASTLRAPTLSQGGAPSQTLLPARIANASTMRAPTLTIGPVSVRPPKIANAPTLRQPTLSGGGTTPTQTLGASRIANAAILRPPMVFQGVSPTLIAARSDAMARPTVSIRVYDGITRDGIRQRDLSIYKSAQFTRTRNAVTTFEIVIPLVPVNEDLVNQVREGWLFEFWSEAPSPRYLFGGFVNYLSWSLDSGQTILTVRGLSYLGWLAQRRLVGGTGSLAWAATLGGLETLGDPPAINEIMYHAMTYNPYSLSPPGTGREHPSFRIPNDPAISKTTDAYSTPTLPVSYAIPRVSNTELTPFMTGIEVMSYLADKVGDRKNIDPTSFWFGMPRISYDIIRYTGPAVGAWPTNALYFVIGVPGLGMNRTVGGQASRPTIFDVDGGGVSEGSYIEDSGDVRNYMITLGAGEKATRTRIDYSNAPSITRYGLIEDVVDAGQEGNPNVLAQKGQDALTDKQSAKITAKFRLDAIPGQVFGYDFFFDDAVTVYWEKIGLTLNDFVTSITLSMGGNDDGSLGIQHAEVVVGSEKLAMSDSGAALGRYLNGLKRGITNIRV